MKKLLCALLVLLLVGCMSAAMAEGCIYNSEEYPCEPGWELDRENQRHRRVCFRHVEDKEDAFSHMPITAWESCTLDEGGKCTGCGHDYEEDIVVDPGELPDEELAIWMLEMYMWYLEENGIPPVEVSASGNQLTVKLTSGYFEYLDAMGIPYGESMMVRTTYTLSLPEGLTYPYNGQAVKPQVNMDPSEYGPGAWLKEMGMMVFEVSYRNNKAPGTATAVVEVYLEGGESYTLQQDFTIEGEGPYCKYGSASSPCDIRWDASNRKHASFCMNHVEVKDDPYSYVQVTDWEACTFQTEEYICDTCGADYTPSSPSVHDYDAMMVEIYYRLLEKKGEAPLLVSVQGNYATIQLNEQFIMYMLEFGIPVTAELQAETVIALTLPEGVEYPYEGRPVFPETSLDMSPDGPGAWMKRVNLLYNDSVQYENNDAPGTAKAKMAIHADGMSAINLAAEFTILGEVSGEHCKYYAPDSPCDVIWWVDSDNRQHCRACRNHVEDKEDMYSYVRLTEWEDCTLDEGGKCTTCGVDYVKEPDEDNSHIYMLEYYMMLSAEMGSAPVNAAVSGNKLILGMHKDFFRALERAGVPVSETMMVDTTYTLTLPDGNTYAFDGAPVTPAVKVEKSEYGPGAWLEKNGLLSFGEVTYHNNTAPGTATASVEVTLKRGNTYTLSIPFTIEGDGPYCKYGSASSPCDICWTANAAAQQHRSYCRNHVEIKEDPYSYVQVTGWEDCTLDENQVCTVCGASYAAQEPDTDDYDALMLELYNQMMEETGRAPIYVEYGQNNMTVQFTEDYLNRLMEYGIPVDDGMNGITAYTFNFTEDSYAFSGEEICPEVIMDSNGKGPGAWLEKHELIYIRDVTYSDNVEPGQATAMVRFLLVGDGNLLFTLNFTIEGEAVEEPKLPGDADGDSSVTLSDALDLLRAVAGEDVDINAANADVNGDGNTDLHDVLLILQYIAGWNVSLK